MAGISSKKKIFFLIIAVTILLSFSFRVKAASLSASPSAGTFTVGSTIEVPIYLDTKGQSINAVAVFLTFSPDKLQLVSPSSGHSIIGIWATPPRFNNKTGTIELQGLINNGINTSNGLITTLTFRVKAVGQTVIKFMDDTKVLLNDGVGTDALQHVQNAIYNLSLPPPAGPIVTSETHPDPTKWYSSSNLIVNWASSDDPVEGYSYILNNEPVATPDDISEGTKTSLVYRSLADGPHYFHIKALRNGSWGGLTHFAALVDTTPPAQFKVEIIPSARTTRREPLIQWESTDAFSGVDHSELKTIPLAPGASVVQAASDSNYQTLFIEAESPYLMPEFERGQYDVIVRVYDRAGNYQEVTERLAVVNALFKPIAEQGLEIGGVVTLPWFWVWLILLVIIITLVLIAFKIRNWHRTMDERRAKKILPAEVKQQLEELKNYRAKYGKIALIFALITMSGFGSLARAAEIVSVSPPVVTTVSRAITNEDIFYLGGKTEVANTPVVIYLQNLNTGETLSQTVTSDKKGEWFYTHNTFLSGGNYRLWAQTHLGEEWSPPSPETQMIVRITALQFGTSRLSYSIIFFVMIIGLLLVMIGLVIYILIYHRRGRAKHALIVKEVREAEESVKRGFAVLRRDIVAELAVIKKAKLENTLAKEAEQTETLLLKDLADVERYIGREIWEVEQAEG